MNSTPNVALYGEASPRRRFNPAADMDMTSMVDVTFLLLIFFMVTASFIIQAAFQTPTTNDGNSAVLADHPTTRVEVAITENGEFEVTVDGSEAKLASNKYELRRELEYIVSVRTDDIELLLRPDPNCKQQHVISGIDVMTELRVPFRLKILS